jgi:DNA-binding transcriptional regulator YdaS (Cro superfamily)
LTAVPKAKLPPVENYENPTAIAIERGGGPVRMAKHLTQLLQNKADFRAKQKLTSGIVSYWLKCNCVKAEYVLAVEEITQIPRHELRPDLYPPEEYGYLQASRILRHFISTSFTEPSETGHFFDGPLLQTHR